MPWDEWEKCAVFIGISGCVGDTRTSTRGTKVMGIHTLIFHESPHFCVYTSGFGRRRCTSPPLPNEQDCMTEKEMPFKDRRKQYIEANEGTNLRGC